MKSSILDSISSPEDLKNLSFEELGPLCTEIRQTLIQTTAKSGGHLASNLGTVELTVALHRVFDCPQDQIVWDVGHQCYTHKLLTGRKDQFSTLRQEGGLSGFPKRKESVYDAFVAGHSSTSISVASGLARAKSLQHDNHHVIAVIGDGAFTSGLAFEGANNAARFRDNLIVILNDNKMSISKNVGSFSKYLSKIRSRPAYFKTKDTVESVFNHVPLVGKPIARMMLKTKNMLKTVVYGSNWFEDMGFYYLGPVDGHNLETLCDVLTRAKELHRPVFLHVETQKGKGYSFAEENPGEYHGTSGFDIDTGKSFVSGGTNFSNEFGLYLTELAKKDSRICAITAAMKYGTGLNYFSHAFKEEGRFYDVGIAEPHAVTFAGGLAANGMLPVFAVYSSFLQRCYDEIIHDLSIEEQHVVIGIDRAGIVGNDGETHQGLFDLAYLSGIPNMTVMSPKNKWEFADMIRFAIEFHGPIAIRYPRGAAYDGLQEFREPIVYGKSEVIYEEQDIAVFAVGHMMETAEAVCAQLRERGYHCSLINVRFVKPFDQDILKQMSRAHRLFVSIEEGLLDGGYGEKIANYAARERMDVCVLQNGIQDEYVEHGNVELLRKEVHLDADSIVEKIVATYDALK